MIRQLRLDSMSKPDELLEIIRLANRRQDISTVIDACKSLLSWSTCDRIIVDDPTPELREIMRDVIPGHEDRIDVVRASLLRAVETVSTALSPDEIGEWIRMPQHNSTMIGVHRAELRALARRVGNIARSIPDLQPMGLMCLVCDTYSPKACPTCGGTDIQWPAPTHALSLYISSRTLCNTTWSIDIFPDSDGWAWDESDYRYRHHAGTGAKVWDDGKFECGPSCPPLPLIPEVTL